MSEFDLVPNSYRKTIKLKHQLLAFIKIYGLLILLIVGAKWMLENKINTVEKQIQQQQLDKQGFLLKEQRYNKLLTNISKLKRQSDVLGGLRGGIPVVTVFEILDRVMTKDVWVDSLDFARAGEWTEPEPESVNMGYLIIIPEGGSKREQKAWRLSTHMSLMGQAMDHSSLAQFVWQLLKQPEIGDVKVKKTALKQYTANSVIDFSLAITVNNQAVAEK